MPNRNLTPDQLELARALLRDIRGRLSALAKAKLLAIFRRQANNHSSAPPGGLPEKHAVLDRIAAAKRYTPESTRLICEACDSRGAGGATLLLSGEIRSEG